MIRDSTAVHVRQEFQTFFTGLGIREDAPAVLLDVGIPDGILAVTGRRTIVAVDPPIFGWTVFRGPFTDFTDFTVPRVVLLARTLGAAVPFIPCKPPVSDPARVGIAGMLLAGAAPTDNLTQEKHEVK